jgi:branched-chain amino acid transport system permease protein/urea transport system permease protein
MLEVSQPAKTEPDIMAGMPIQLALDFLWAFSALALIALSLGLVLGELKVVNIAQGDMVMIGAYCMYAMRDLPFPVALAASVVIGLLVGALIEILVLRRIYPGGFIGTLLACWGIGIVVQQVVSVIFSISQKGVAAPIAGTVDVLGVAYPAYRLVASAMMLAMVLAVLFLIYRTAFGLRVRASIDNAEMAALVGASPQLMKLGVFALATAMAVFAGALISPTLALTPTMGIYFIGPAFFAVLIAREGSIVGPVIGAAVVQSYFVLLKWLLPLTLAECILFGSLILLMIVWPNGITWTIMGGYNGKKSKA